MNSVFKAVALGTSANALSLLTNAQLAAQANQFIEPEGGWKDPLDYFEAADVVNAKNAIKAAY